MKLTSITLVVAGWAANAYAEDPVAPVAPKPAPVAARSLVIHVAPLSSPVGEPVELQAMLDAPYAETLSARWRALGETTWHDVPFERSSAGGWYASLPAAPSPGLEYYIRGVDVNGAEVAHFASAAAPHMVRVDPALFDRLEDLDRRRQLGLRDQIALEITAHNFGNRYDQPDRFGRAEATFTHRLWRQLHHLAFGFGTIWGKTPVASPPSVPTLPTSTTG